jgi:hypothetical protein
LAKSNASQLPWQTQSAIFDEVESELMNHPNFLISDTYFQMLGRADLFL